MFYKCMVKTAHNSFRILLISASIAVIALFVCNILMARAETNLQIYDVNVSYNDRNVIITWNTNLPSDSRIDFGLDQSYGTYFLSNGLSTINHSMSISGLDSETTYHYKVTSRSSAGESISSFDRSFKTIKFKDQTLPVISNVHITYITGTTATLQWETDEEADSQVNYGKTSQHGSRAGSGTRTRIHDITLKGLQIAAVYHVQVSSRDKDGNVATYVDQQFTTLLNGEADKVPLAITDITPVTLNDTDITTDSAVISWRTNKLANGVVYYGINNIRTRVEPKVFRDFFYSVKLTDLKPGTVYSFAVESTDIFGKRLKSDTFSFKTKDLPKPSAYTFYASNDQPIILGFSTLDYTEPTALYRLQGTPHIYAIFKNQKYHIPNVASLKIYASFGKSIQNMSQDKLDAIPYAQLVKAHNSQTVYYLYRRGNDRFIKLALPSPSVFMSYPRNKWSDIVTLDATDVSSFQNAVLIKTPDSPDIYLIENGGKRHIISEQAFIQLGFRYDNVVAVSQMHMDSYPAGPVIE